MTKSHWTDVVSLALIGSAFVLPEPFHDPMLYGGLFALSGAVTNQLAIHMLFHRVPGLYGSGVIEHNFERFKTSIRTMVMEQFFTIEKINAFLDEKEQQMDLSPLVESADFNPAFDALKSSVLESSLGQMLQMFGGESALEPMREGFNRKLKSAVSGIVASEAFVRQLQHHVRHSTFSSDLMAQIEQIITRRMEELSPKMVKKMVFDLMDEHLGWLVVWGGVFGGLIGVVSSVVLGV